LCASVGNKSVEYAYYIYRATMHASSAETTVFMRHLVLVILVCRVNSTLHTWQSSTQNTEY